jgi:hypothetical protein
MKFLQCNYTSEQNIYYDRPDTDVNLTIIKQNNMIIMIQRNDSCL